MPLSAMSNRLPLVTTCTLLVGLIAAAPMRVLGQTAPGADATSLPVVSVLPTDDFEIMGGGHRSPWQLAEPFYLRPRDGNTVSYETTLRLLYSDTGLYILVEATDSLLNATYQDDYLHLWEEDVFEAFLWPDERYTIYFEYEISPLGFELPLIIPNFDDTYLGWIPWEYEGARKTRKKVVIRGGEPESEAAIDGWFMEIFIPYELLRPLQNVPPTPGSRWRANFYRNDYDGESVSRWDWSRTGSSYHEFRKFGVLVFE